MACWRPGAPGVHHTHAAEPARVSGEAPGEIRVVPLVEPGLHEDGLLDAGFVHVVEQELHRGLGLRAVAGPHRPRVLSRGGPVPDVRVGVDDRTHRPPPGETVGVEIFIMIHVFILS